MGTSVTIAYVWAIVASLVFLLIAALVSNMILNKPGGKDITQRRIWYWVLFVIAVGGGFAINMVLAAGIKIPSKHADFVMHSAIAAGVAALIYILLGLCLSKGMKRSKLGSWF